MTAAAVDVPTLMTVSYRCANSVPGKAWESAQERTEPWASASLDLIVPASPWRIFRWYRGQRHGADIVDVGSGQCGEFLDGAEAAAVAPAWATP